VTSGAAYGLSTGLDERGEAGTAARKLAGLRNKTGVKPLAPSMMLDGGRGGALEGGGNGRF
jgi:hypothetical protein